MAIYKYIATKKDGSEFKGNVDMPNEAEVRIFLRQQGARPVKIEKESIWNKELEIPGLGKKVTDSELSIMTRQLAVMIESGVPILQALDILQAGEKNDKLKKIVAEVAQNISEGTPFWEALSKQKSTFSQMYIYLVRAGEMGGALDLILNRLAKYMDDAVRMNRKVKSAMIYPVVICAVGMAVTAGLLIFVVPKFEQLLAGADKELPALTALVIDISHWLQANFLYVSVGLFAAVALFKKAISQPEGKKRWHKFLLSLPFFSDLLTKAGVARFSRTMGTMLSSGVNLMDAIDICKVTIDNVVMEEALSKVREEVSAGKSIALPLAETRIFPPMVVQMINVGENTGALDSMLARIAEFYEQEVEVAVDNLTKLIEPVILVLLGGMVAFILIAMYLPVFSMSDATDSM